MRKSFLLVVVLAFACPLFASQASFLPDDEARELLQGVDEERYPDTDAVIVLSDAEDSFDEEGRRRLVEHILVKVLTSEGKKEYTTVGRAYNPQYNEIRFLRARTIRDDGSVVELPLDVKTMPSPGWSIFWGGMQRVLEVPDLQPGSALEYAVQQRGVQVAFLGEEEKEFIPPMRGQFYNVVLFQDRAPILEKRYVLNGPKSKPIQQLVVNGELEYSSHEENQRVIHSWRKKNSPRIIREPAMPRLADVATKLVVTTVPSWEWISRWMSDLSEPSFEADDAIREKVSELTRNANTDEEKLRSLYDFVAKDIRYVGLSMGEGEGYTPHPAVMTFRERGGVCKDKAGLLVCMLRQAGFPAYIAMTMVGEKVEDIPADQFNHAIVAVKREAEWLFLDPTMGGYDLTPNFEQGQGTLIATPEGTGLCPLPWVPPERSVCRIVTNSTLTPEGGLKGEARIENTGIFDYQLRSWIGWTPPSRRMQIVETLVKQISPNAELVGYSLSDEKDYTMPIEVELTYEVKDYCLKAGQLLLFRPVPGTAEIAFGGGFWDAVYTPERRYPVKTRSTHRIDISSSVRVPPGYELKGLPEPVIMSNEMGEFACEHTQEENEVLSNTRFQVNAPIVPLEKVPELRTIVTQARLAEKGWIVLERGGEE